MPRRIQDYMGPKKVAFRQTGVRRKLVKAPISKPAAKAVRSIVKKEIHKQAEDKFSGVVVDQTFNSTISSGGECYSLVPSVSVGNLDNQRIGDKIRGKYLMIKGYVQIAENQINYIPPSTVRVMILSQKNLKTHDQVATTPQPAVDFLLKDNVASSAARAYGGGRYDNLAPINKEMFRVHMDRKFRFNWTNQQTPTAGTGVPTVGWQAGNDRTKYFTCRIKLNRTLTYDDVNGLYPNSLSPFICVGSVCDDDEGPFTLQTPWHVCTQSILYYEDS